MRNVRRFLSSQNPNVVMLQDTKRQIWDKRFVSSVWKGRNMEWAALPTCGASGGIVIIWDSNKFKCTEKVLRSFSVTVKLNSSEEESFWLTSFYGPNKPLWRKDFWLELQDLYGLTFPMWCVGGDFHVIRRISKKLGDSRLTFNMRLFLFARGCLQEALPRWTSDHNPICLETNPLKWGPTPFRFENMWLLHHEFKEKFSDWWQGCTVEGWEGHKFMRKLKFVKSKLKDWNKVAFGDLREKKKLILSDLARIDLIEQEGNLNLDLVSERTLRRRELEDLLLKEEVHWRQKSRVKWIKEGDCNSKFFHRMTNGRQNRKFIKSLISERKVTLSNIKVISEEIVNFFGKLYSKPKGASWRIEGVDWVIILGESAVWLDRPFSEEEVLSGRLRKVLHETIYGSQGAFVEERHILDAVLIANEVVDEKRRSCARKEGVQPEMEILDNGMLVFIKFCNPNVLSRLMIRAEESGLTEGFFVGRDKIRVSLLQFADDTIFFFKASLEHLQNLKIILLVFGQVSGLKINLEKNTISGLPLRGNSKTIDFWDPVVERILRRLDGWKNAFLSLGGRITLIQSSLSHIPSYFLSLFKIPVSIASKIEKPQKDFLWSRAGEGKKDHLIR
ncbi:hypothetical protein CK203_076874 [Vitis vinifera]|uniref:Uncharacterized protein n=1 Tax=Vitis vinifera TaxID=29760 RepID=A0A438ET41_VITVI|nr:hypothetical protein CK203_076874 [Vitis vinifera]